MSKKTIENAYAVFAAVVGVTAAYLIGAFVTAEFNITHWTSEARIWIAFLMVFAGGFAAMVAKLGWPS